MHNEIFGIDIQGLLIPGISILEKMIRPILVYLLLVIGLRLAGKREMAQMNTFDMVVLLTLSNTVQNAIIGNDNSLSGGIIGAATLLIINYLMVRLVFNNKRFEHIIEGSPDLLIKNGHVKINRLKKELITLTELEEAAHKQGIFSLTEVDKAILDTNGVISFFQKESSLEIIRHREILKKLDVLSHEIEKIKNTVS